MKQIQVIVASHKPYRMPDDPMYIPVHVGAECSGNPDEAGFSGFARDNTGENISALNPCFCELTGLYWAWKNLNADYLGLAHYRRHFSLRRGRDVWDSVLREEQIRPFLETKRIFLPHKRNYVIETLYSHYLHTHQGIGLDETRKILADRYPQYLSAFDRAVHRTSGYMFNMLIMERGLLSEYCEWLFDILFDLQRIMEQTEGYGKLDPFDRRFYGRISEILLNVWLDRQLDSRHILGSEIQELKVLHMEKVDWWKKGKAFLMAKFFKEKYRKSF